MAAAAWLTVMCAFVQPLASLDRLRLPPPGERQGLWRALDRLSGCHARIRAEDLGCLARGEVRGRTDPAHGVQVAESRPGVGGSGVRGTCLGSGDVVGERAIAETRAAVFVVLDVSPVA